MVRPRSLNDSLQPTALVREAWLRLAAALQRTWENRGHFFGAAAEAMRRILIDHSRRRHAGKRGGAHLARVDLENVDLAVEIQDDANR
jgi:ECF sigma factor